MLTKRLWVTLITLSVLTTLAVDSVPALIQPSISMPVLTDSATPVDSTTTRDASMDPPTIPPGPDAGLIQTANGLWMMPAGVQDRSQPVPQTPTNTGGPDEFGYVWDDTLPLNWISAEGGIDTGINASISHVGPIDIGFSFKYYENTRTQLYISRFGFLAFNDVGIDNSQSETPSTVQPNDVIAPHWVPADQVYGYVRYLRGGSAPNRWLLVEWNRIVSVCCSDLLEEYTFEAILYENGNITFQYNTMANSGAHFCQASGVEDSTGLDGLSITPFCENVPGSHAVQIMRPPISARVRLRPQFQGRFVRPGENGAFQMTIRNTGELGTDTYDITRTSTWPVVLLAADGVTPLSDTDSDGVVDTGPVGQGLQTEVTARISAPGAAAEGSHNELLLTARSSRNTSRQVTASVRTSVPGTFAQVYRDNFSGGMSLYLVQPTAQSIYQVGGGNQYGYDLAVAEAPSSYFVYLWTQWWCLDSSCDLNIQEITYALLDRNGQTVWPAQKLTDHSSATIVTHDYDPAVAVTPNGYIGVVWRRYLWNQSTEQFNYNVHMAVLSPAGDLVFGPARVTNNDSWGTGNELNVPRFYSARLTATADNHFVLAWERAHRETAGWVNDIWHAVRDYDGSTIKPVTKYTNDTPGESYFDTPVVTGLSANRVLLVWFHRVPANDDIYYAVLDSAGNVVRGATNLSVDEDVADWGTWDAVQLASGRTIVVWQAWGCFPGEWRRRLRIALLDPSYNRIGNPTCIDIAPGSSTGDIHASVTSDGTDRAILTWMGDQNSRSPHLFYALVDGNGTIVTPAMIFQTSQATQPHIFTGQNGYGNTTFGHPPPAATPTPTPTATRTPTPTPTQLPGAAGMYLPWIGRQPTPTPTATPTCSNDPYEPNESFVQAWGPLPLNRDFFGFFNCLRDTDRDFYYFYQNAHRRVVITLDGITLGSDYDLTLFGSDTHMIEFSGTPGNASERIDVTIAAGIYYVRVTRSPTSPLVGPPYRLLVATP